MRMRRLAFTIVELLVVIAIIGILVPILLPPTCGHPRMPSRQQMGRFFLEDIDDALSQYHEKHGTFPPAYIVDAEGNPLHSWRTLLLPYLGQQALYDSIDLTKPWDDPVNAAARETVLPRYSCPFAHEDPMTTYLAFVGPDWAFAGAEPRTLDEIEDGAANTLAVIDVGEGRAVHWMSPEDIDVERPFDLQSESNHPDVRNVLYLDGDVNELSPDTSPEAFAAMLTIAGGEKVEPSNSAAAGEAGLTEPKP